MGKEVKTNAMRILDRLKLPYTLNSYECKEFIDGVHIADMLGQDPAQSFKTLVCSGKGGGYYVFVLPVARELDPCRGRQGGGAAAGEGDQRCHRIHPGRLYCHRHEKAVSYGDRSVCRGI